MNNLLIQYCQVRYQNKIPDKLCHTQARPEFTAQTWPRVISCSNSLQGPNLLHKLDATRV